MATKVVGYVRVSRVSGRSGDSFLSPELQREQINHLAKRDGLQVVEVLEELDKSGGDAKRPEWNRAIEMVEAGKVAGIAVWNLSRFSRSVKDAILAMERIEAAGGRVYSATENLDDKMLRTFLLAIAENERDRATANFRAAVANALDRGIAVTSRIPVGYVRNADRRLEIDPDKAPIVQGIFERRAQGMSWTRLAKWSTEQGHPITQGTVTHIVSNRTYIGELRSGDEVRENAAPALVSKSLFKKANQKQKRSRRPGTLTRKYLLQGIATCDACGTSLYLSNGKPRAGNPDGAHYRCRNLHCPGPRAYATAHALDSYVLNVVFGYEDDEVSVPGLIDAISPSTWVATSGDDVGTDEARAELEEAQANLDAFLDNRKAIDILGAERWNQEAEEYVVSVSMARDALERAQEQSEPSYELLGRLWVNEWGHPERVEWLGRMIEHVTVRRARPRSEPLSERVEVELRALRF